MDGALLLALGEVDCERIGGGWLAQPVNALSSLAYVAAGGWLLARARRSGDRAFLAAAGAAVAAVGFGSIAYHGPQPAWAGWAHDGPILAFPLVLAARSAWTLRRRDLRFATAYAAGGVAVLGVVGGLGRPGTALGLPAAAAVAVAGTFLVLPVPAAARLWSRPALLMAAALAAYVLGRTGSPLCRPGGPWQLHGAWHVLSAAALGSAAARFTGRSRAEPDRVVSRD